MKLKFKYGLFCIFLLCSTIAGHAQRGYTMNFLSLVPQQNKYNPAYYTRYETYIGVPTLSGFQLQVNNDAFAWDRTFTKIPGTTLIDVPKMISHLSAENNIGVDFNLDLLSFGFKVGENNQFHVGLSREGYINALLTKRSLSLLLSGTGGFIGLEGADALTGNFVDINIYDALSLGYSREVNERLSVGGRVKLLSGIANLHTDRSNIRLFIDEGLDPEVVPYTHILTPDVALNGSFSAIPQDSNLLYLMRNFVSVTMDEALSMLNPKFDNFGIGLDLGAVYQVTENVTLGASVYDIGFINWNKNVQRITSQGQAEPFVFSGVAQFNDLINNEDFDILKVLGSLRDSVIDFLQLKEGDTTFTSYRSPLRTSYNLSFFYDITDNDQIGIMWNSQLGKRKYNALTLAYTRSLGRNFQVCFNNAIINDNMFNFGGGFAFNAGGSLQLYVVADKISAIRVADMRTINIQFGLNIALNRTEKDPNKRRFVRDFTPRDRTGYVNDRWFW